MTHPTNERLGLPHYDAMQEAIAEMLEEAQAGFPNLPDDPVEALAILAMTARNLTPEQRYTTIRCRSMTNGIKLTKQMLRDDCHRAAPSAAALA